MSNIAVRLWGPSGNQGRLANSKRQPSARERVRVTGSRRSDSGPASRSERSDEDVGIVSTRVETLSRDDPPANRARPIRNWRQMFDNKLKTPFIALVGAIALMSSAPAFAQTAAPAAPAAASAAPAAAPAPAAPAADAGLPPQM